MPSRLQVSTDVASLGIWDAAASRGATTIEVLAGRGEACIIPMGADCSGAVDIFVNEDIPTHVCGESTAVSGERTVVIRSGEVVIDGVEYFGPRRSTPSEGGTALPLPNGVYRAAIRITKDEDTLPEPPSEEEIRRIVGASEVDYFDRISHRVLWLTLSTLLALPILLFFVRWFVAIPATVVIFFSAVNLQHWILARNPRYQKLAETIPRLRLEGERPLLVVQFSSKTAPLVT